MALRPLLLAAVLAIAAPPARAQHAASPLVAEVAAPRAEGEDKSALLAGTFGFVLPGAGHLYAGEPGRGALTFITFIGSGALIAEGPDSMDAVGGLLLLGAWAFGAVDGALAAYRHNTRAEPGRLSLDAGPAPHGGWLGMRLALPW